MYVGPCQYFICMFSFIVESKGEVIKNQLCYIILCYVVFGVVVVESTQNTVKNKGI